MNVSRIAFAAAVAALSVSAVAFADEEVKKSPELSVTIGGTINDGNTEDETASLAVDFADVVAGCEYKLGANGNITRVATETVTENEDGSVTTSKDKKTTAKNGEIKGKMLFPLEGRLSAYLDAGAFADEIADVDYRIKVGPGLAYDFVKTESLVFAVELGVSPMWEKIAGECEYYTAARVAERLEYVFAGGAKVWESFEYLPALNDSEKYFINSEVGVESPLNDTLSLRVVAKDSYNSIPAAGCEKNDLSITAGIRIKL